MLSHFSQILITELVVITRRNFVCLLDFQVKMTNFLDLHIPRKSFHTYDFVVLGLFVTFKIPVIGISTGKSLAELQCDYISNSEKKEVTLSYVNEKCSFKYEKEYQVGQIPMYGMFVFNFGVVLITSIIYAYLVKHRVEIFDRDIENQSIQPSENPRECLGRKRKRKRTRKFVNKVRATFGQDLFEVQNDFSGIDISRSGLDEMYVHVIVKEGRNRRPATSEFQRQVIYEYYLKTPDAASTFKCTADIFKPTKNGEQTKHPRTILVVGQPGIGKLRPC